MNQSSAEYLQAFPLGGYDLENPTLNLKAHAVNLLNHAWSHAVVARPFSAFYDPKEDAIFLRLLRSFLK